MSSMRNSSMRFPRPERRDPKERAEASRKYYRKHSSDVNERIRKWRGENPRKRAAHLAVKRALYNGELVTPETCEECSNKRCDAHHDDYSKPLVVLWLCRKHHRERHRKLRQEGRDPDA